MTSQQTDNFLPIQLQTPNLAAYMCAILVVHSDQYISKFTAGLALSRAQSVSCEQILQLPACGGRRLLLHLSADPSSDHQHEEWSQSTEFHLA